MGLHRGRGRERGEHVNGLRHSMTARLPPKLVDALFETHAEMKRAFLLGGHRLNGIEGGRFCEAAFRILEFLVAGSFTPIGKDLDTTKIISSCEKAPSATLPASIRIHIPRALRVIYDFRNKRDVAHLADGIDPNIQDASLVVGVVDWVLAELVRLFHGVTPAEAQRVINELVAPRTPVVQVLGGDLKVLRPDVGAGDHCLLLLYHRGAAGGQFDELSRWVRPRMRTNLRRTLTRLEHELDLVHCDGNRYFITHRGELEVARRGLLEAA